MRGAGRQGAWTQEGGVVKYEAIHLGDHARLGLAGGVLDLFRPHSEASEAGLLADFLAAFGNAIGTSPHMLADSAVHHARLSIVLVGRSARARKGSTRAAVARLMRHVDPPAAERVMTGLSSGEGLIEMLSPTEENPDPDNRVLVAEPEFARTLKVAARDGSILSPILRQAWDSGDLAVITRHHPLSVKGAHVSVIGHITAEELTRSISDSDLANGFANRFLWVWVERSKRIPDGDSLSEKALSQVGDRIRNVLNQARRIGRMSRTPEASRLWEAFYVAVDDDVTGILGHVTSRIEAQVLRLSMIYALLDASREIDVPHLMAAPLSGTTRPLLP